jgi:hypothetical protein
VFSKRHGQIANDITYAANLAPGNRSILGCDEQDLLRIDNVVPV